MGQEKKEWLKIAILFTFGGEDEIRTHGGVTLTTFPMLRLRPLGHLSEYATI